MTPNKAYANRSGVYSIVNTVNGKVYIGQTTCMFKRCKNYIYDFKNKRTRQLNDALLQDMSAFGIDKFEMSALEFCENADRIECEKKWMLFFNSTDANHGYNLRMDDSSGMITHARTSEKIRSNLLSQWNSGARDAHSEKLKRNWAENSRRKSEQGRGFTETLTKYTYKVTTPSGEVLMLKYKELAAIGLKNCIAEFARKKSNYTMYKSHSIERITTKERSW